MRLPAHAYHGGPERVQGHAESRSDHGQLTFSTYVPRYMDSVNLTMMNHTTNPEDQGAPPASAAPPPRHRRLRRGLIVCISILTVTLIAVGAGLGYLHWRLSQFKRIDVAAAVLDRPGTSVTGNRGTYNTLLIGTDSRADVSAAQAATFGKGEVGGNRSDTIMIMRTDPDTGQVAILSLPRDLYVHISGTARLDRINAAYAKSTTTLVQTIKDNFNIPITHVVEVNFEGFQSLVGTVGGVYIDFPRASRDTVTGLNQPAGRNLLSPEQAIAFVRSRHFQTGVGGTWTTDGSGDLGRVVRQQTFIRAVLQRARQKGASNPLAANALLAHATGAVKLDPTFSVGDLGSLASDFRSFDPAMLKTFTLPGISARINRKSVLRVDHVAADKVVATFEQAV